MISYFSDKRTIRREKTYVLISKRRKKVLHSNKLYLANGKLQIKICIMWDE